MPDFQLSNVDYVVDLSLLKGGTKDGTVVNAKLEIMDDQTLSEYADLNKTSYKVMPSNCYEVSMMEFNFSSTEKYKSINIRVKIKEFKEAVLENGTNLVLPLILKTNDGSIYPGREYILVAPQI